jgi:hypothetical protein
MSVPKKVRCPECNGTGECWDGEDCSDCDLCEGTGEVPEEEEP